MTTELQRLRRSLGYASAEAAALATGALVKNWRNWEQGVCRTPPIAARCLRLHCLSAALLVALEEKAAVSSGLFGAEMDALRKELETIGGEK